MISRVIDWCANNRFLVFTGTALLLLTGIWSLKNIPLDALPDISDVQVIVHIPWEGQPPNIIEDQVTYPIVSTLLAAPHVKAVRAQTMFGDSYIFVVFEDGTDLYWARSRVLEYIQQLQGVLPKNVSPMIGPDATGAGWVYEYAVIDHSHRHSLAELRTLQDWYLRFQLETVPGVAEVASMGGFIRQYQANLDPNKLRAYNIPLSMVIDRVRDSTNEVGGRVLEMAGARYMIRGLGYLRSLQDLESVPVATKNGTPVLVRDLGTVAFGPDIREGVAEWNGEGEVVGGIIVMRDGMNALTVIDGVKKRLAEIKPALPAGVEIVSGYDRSGLIHDSIKTLQRDLLLEVAITTAGSTPKANSRAHWMRRLGVCGSADSDASSAVSVGSSALSVDLRPTCLRPHRRPGRFRCRWARWSRPLRSGLDGVCSRHELHVGHLGLVADLLHGDRIRQARGSVRARRHWTS